MVDEIALAREARELSATADTRPDRIGEARQRVGNGLYDTAEVRVETAERILDKLA